MHRCVARCAAEFFEQIVQRLLDGTISSVDTEKAVLVGYFTNLMSRMLQSLQAVGGSGEGRAIPRTRRPAATALNRRSSSQMFWALRFSCRIDIWSKFLGKTTGRIILSLSHVPSLSRCSRLRSCPEAHAVVGGNAGPAETSERILLSPAILLRSRVSHNPMG